MPGCIAQPLIVQLVYSVLITAMASLMCRSGSIWLLKTSATFPVLSKTKVWQEVDHVCKLNSVVNVHSNASLRSRGARTCRPGMRPSRFPFTPSALRKAFPSSLQHTMIAQVSCAEPGATVRRPKHSPVCMHALLLTSGAGNSGAAPWRTQRWRLASRQRCPAPLHRHP